MFPRRLPSLPQSRATGLLRHIRTTPITRKEMTSPTPTDIPPLSRDFPSSSAVPSSYFHFPGITPASTAVVRRTLEENNRKYDIFEKTRFFHNHFPHSMLTRYALGAPPALLEDTWKLDKQHLTPLDPHDAKRKKDAKEEFIPSQGITRDNWASKDWLGHKEAYSAYLTFFHEEIARLGAVGTVQEYILSPQANWKGEAPNMLQRLVAGAVHPFIHAGFGLEFNDRIVLAEGLAEAAIHSDSLFADLFPPQYPQALYTSENTPSPSSSPISKTPLEVYAEICDSPACHPGPYDPDMLFNDRLLSAAQGERGRETYRLTEAWDLSDQAVGDGEHGWRKRVDELAVLVTLLACATSKPHHDTRIDFFLMHALTSSLFLPAYLAPLSMPDRRAILKTYLLCVLHTAISRGRPRIYPDVIMSYSASPAPPGGTGARDQAEALSRPSDPTTRNAWLPIVDSSLYYPDSHVPKAIRSLLYHSTRLGHTPAGELPGAYSAGSPDRTAESFKGMGSMDGSVFLRAAGSVMDTLGWVREGQRGGEWDRSALGWDEAWGESDGVDR